MWSHTMKQINDFKSLKNDQATLLHQEKQFLSLASTSGMCSSLLVGSICALVDANLCQINHLFHLSGLTLAVQDKFARSPLGWMSLS